MCSCMLCRYRLTLIEKPTEHGFFIDKHDLGSFIINVIGKRRVGGYECVIHEMCAQAETDDEAIQIGLVVYHSPRLIKSNELIFEFARKHASKELFALYQGRHLLFDSLILSGAARLRVYVAVIQLLNKLWHSLRLTG